jgi:hypothetical protein
VKEAVRNLLERRLGFGKDVKVAEQRDSGWGEFVWYIIAVREAS